jgi:hypothetical protein
MRAAEHHLSLETRPRRSGLAAPELLALGVGELRRCIVRNVRPARPREPVNSQRVTTVASWPPLARHLRTTNGGAGDSWDGERSEGGEVPQSAADADSSQGRSEETRGGRPVPSIEVGCDHRSSPPTFPDAVYDEIADASSPR